MDKAKEDKKLFFYFLAKFQSQIQIKEKTLTFKYGN